MGSDQVRGVWTWTRCSLLGYFLLNATVAISQCSSRTLFFLFSSSLFVKGLFHYIVLHCSIPSSTCLSSSTVLEFPFPFLQLFDFLGIKITFNTVQGSSPHKCGQEINCNAFNAVVAAFPWDISGSLSLLYTSVVCLLFWDSLESGLKGSRSSSLQ